MTGLRAALGTLVVAGALTCARTALGDRVTLKDGTVIDGLVLKQGDRYWVKTPDGASKLIPAADVASVTKGSAPAPAHPGDASPAVKAAVGDLASTEKRAGAVDNPTAAVVIWQDFIDSKPSSDDLKSAKEQMVKWKALADSGAEKINGKWIGGDERKQIVTKANNLTKEGWDLLIHNETLKGESKLEEARKLYPNSYHVNFVLGYLEMLKHGDDRKPGKFDKAQAYFNTVLKIKPNLPEALANLGLILWEERRYEAAINQIYRAAKEGDTHEIAYDLWAAINKAPPALQRNSSVQKAKEDAQLLLVKYNIDPNEWQNHAFMLVGLHDHPKSGEPELAGGMVSGSGFVINAQGLILTNRHVVKGGKTFMVMLHGGGQKSAEVVVIDDEQDLALIRLKGDVQKLPVVQLAPSDAPSDGAECTVIGYPLIDRLGGAPKITHGIVSGKRAEGDADVLIDATVNPGNSGGPILDKYGNVMAIVCMKSLASTTENSYGMGISAGRIREFLAKNKVTIAKGTNGSAGLSVEDVAMKVEPAAVLILATR